MSDQWSEVRKLLAELYTQAESEQWLATPNPMLYGYKPLECDPSASIRILRMLLDGAFP